MNDLFRRMYGLVSVKAIAGDPRAFEVIASTDDLDMQGEVLVQDWDLARYTQNPVVLYMHNFCARDPKDSLPVGFSTDVAVQMGKLKSTLHFVDEAASELAELCYQGFKQGSLRAVSVGFRSKLARFETRNDREVFVMSGNELIEISVCPIGINPNTVTTEGKAFGLPDERDALRALVHASKASHPHAPRAPHDAAPADTAEEIPMKIVCKALGLPETASEAEALAAVTAIMNGAKASEQGAKAFESRVLEATGAKTVDEAMGTIKASLTAVGELGIATASLASARADVETRDRDALVKKGVETFKLSPALKEWAMEKTADGKAFKVSVEQLTSFLAKAPTISALAAGGSVRAPVDEPPPGAGAKAWEAMTPAEKHNLNVSAPEVYAASKADWERRGKPEMTYGKKSAA